MKPNSKFTVKKMKEYIRQEGLNKSPYIKLSMRRAELIDGLKKAGHWQEGEEDETTINFDSIEWKTAKGQMIYLKPSTKKILETQLGKELIEEGLDLYKFHQWREAMSSIDPSFIHKYIEYRSTTKDILGHTYTIQDWQEERCDYHKRLCRDLIESYMKVELQMNVEDHYKCVKFNDTYHYEYYFTIANCQIYKVVDELRKKEETMK